MRRILHIKPFFQPPCHMLSQVQLVCDNMPCGLGTRGTPLRSRKHPLPRHPSVHGISSPDSMDGRPSPFSTGSRGLVPAPAAGHGLVLSSAGAGRRVDGGLRSVAEVAATVFQSEKWEGERGWMRGIAPPPTRLRVGTRWGLGST